MKRYSGILAGVVLLVAGPAQSAPLDLLNITGHWVNPVGGTNVSGAGTSTISWGDGAPPDSGYDFSPGADILGAPVGSPLLLGTFTHFNAPIPIPNLTAVDLDFSFDTNGVPASAGAVFAFLHDETPNTGAGSPVDDDIVTITTPLVNIPITVGGDVYFFNLLGFSQDGGVTFNTVFSSPEGANNSAELFGQISLSRVPEPGGLVLLGAGLAAVARARRRRRSA